MTSDLDIYRTANVLIREHGEDAALEAALRADAMLEKGGWTGSEFGNGCSRRSRRLGGKNRGRARR